MADREVSFVRHGDSVVWVSTENGVTETWTEHSPLERDGGHSFMGDALAQLEGTQLQPAHLAPPDGRLRSSGGQQTGKSRLRCVAPDSVSTKPFCGLHTRPACYNWVQPTAAAPVDAAPRSVEAWNTDEWKDHTQCLGNEYSSA